MKISYALVLVTLVSCGELKDNQNAIRAAEGAGLSDVKVTDKHGIAPELNGCAKGDAVAFDVHGKNAQGKTVYATVCCGLILKACTVRF